MIDPQLIGTVLTGGVALAVGLITARAADRKDKKSDSQALIDQLQEERDKAVEVADARTGRLEKRQRILEDYVGQLRQHIDQRLDPPAPPWPTELLT